MFTEPLIVKLVDLCLPLGVQVVTLVCVETRRDQQEVRLKGEETGEHTCLEGVTQLGAGALEAWGQGDVKETSRVHI